VSPAIVAKLKRCLWAVLLGGCVASIPWLGSLTENDQITAVTSFVLLPGIIPGMAAGGGRVHDTSWPVTIWATVIFWIGLAYLCLGWRERRKSIPSSLRPPEV
jgi:hypothetical protein